MAVSTDLAAMKQQMIQDYAGHHRFAHWHGADADAGIMAPFRHDLGVFT